jgi:hypothetical protein
MLALAIAATALLAVTAATTAGHQHLQQGDHVLRAVRLAQTLMDEILSRPYDGSAGGARASWHIDDYDGFTEDLGAITDFTTAPCDDDDLPFGRCVCVAPTSLTVPDLDGAVVPGKHVTVTVNDADGTVFELSRFIAETSP